MELESTAMMIKHYQETIEAHQETIHLIEKRRLELEHKLFNALVDVEGLKFENAVLRGIKKEDTSAAEESTVSYISSNPPPDLL